MKRVWIVCLLPALLLTGCGFATEGADSADVMPAEQVQYAVSKAEPPEAEQETDVQPLAVNEPITQEVFDAIPDEAAVKRLYSGENTAFVPGYYCPEAGREYSIFIAETGKDPIEALQARFPDTKLEIIEENDLYTAFAAPDGGQRPVLVMKQFEMGGNNYAVYKGGLNEESILANFDLIAHDKKIMTRCYRDDPEIKCVSYDFIAVEETEDGNANLGWYCYLIDRNDFLVSMQPEWNLMREVVTGSSVPDVTEEKTAPAEEIVYDIELSFEKTEILIGRDDPQVIVRAIPPAECSPASVKLVNAEWQEVVCELVDDCDFEAHGDDIKGDGWYCNRYTMDTGIDTDPDVSEEKVLQFYAEFQEGTTVHRSDVVSVTVMEAFTDMELDDRERVSDAIEEMFSQTEWKQANTDKRRDMAVACLNRLAEEGLIVPGSVMASEDMITYAFPSGGTGGIKLKPFDPMLN